MRKILVLCQAIILLFLISLRVFAFNLDVYGSVEVHHDYSFMRREGELFEHYLLVNGKARSTANTRSFAFFDLNWRFKENFNREENQVTQESVTEVNEAYLSIQLLNNLVFNIGKKRIPWGIGFAYNPTDFIAAPVSHFNPQLQQGVYNAELSFFHHNFALDTVMVYYDQVEYCGYGWKLSTFSLLPQTDLNFMGYYSKNNRINLGVSLEATPFEVPVWRDLALYSELGLVQTSLRKPVLTDCNFYRRWLTGMRYMHPKTETLVVIEYYYLEDGFNEKERVIALGQYPDLNIPGQSGRENLFFNIHCPAVTRNNHPFTDTLCFSARMITNLEDKSRMVAANITSEMVKNTQIILEGIWYAGDANTEYGALPVEVVYSLVVRVDF